MGFVRVDNYDGEKGYIGDDRLEVFQLKSVKYLIHRDRLIQVNNELISTIEGLEHEAYRIIKEDLTRATAIATKQNIRQLF